MNIDRDELRREARDTQTEHEETLKPFREELRRGIGRRRFLQIGGVGVLSAAVCAACGSDDDKPAAGAGTTSSGEGTKMDLTILRTASSLEHVAIDVYQKAIDNASALGITA